MNILIKNKKNKLIKLLFVMMIFLSCITDIHAFDWPWDKVKEKNNGSETEKSDDLFKNCKNPSECIPICIYQDTDQDDRAYIGYHASTTGWDITANYEGELYIFKDPSRLPEKNIYWESNPGWQGNEGYNNLLNKLECPNYFYLDTKYFQEICFANETDKCSELEGRSTDFGYHRSLSYSFEEEAKKVLLETSTQLTLFNTEVINEIKNGTGIFGNLPKFTTEESRTNEIEKIKKDNIEFLSNYDSDVKYDASLSAEENIKNNCKYIEENAKDIEKYKNKILTSDKINNYDKNVLSKKIAEVSNRFNVRYPEVYSDYSLLEKLISVETKDRQTKKIKRTERVSGYNSIRALLPGNLASSVGIIIDGCNATNNSNIEYNEDEFRESVTEVYSYVTRDNPIIDVDTEFTCNSIFTPEIADLIRKAYFAIEIIAIIILIGLSSLDYAKVILSGEQDEMKKTNQKLIKRLIIVVVIFLLPALINLILRVVHIEGFDSEHPLCVQIKNK